MRTEDRTRVSKRKPAIQQSGRYCGAWRAYVQVCEWKRSLRGGHHPSLSMPIWARSPEIKSVKRRNKEERSERGNYSWVMSTNTHMGVKMEHWCAINKYNKFKSFPQVQPSNLRMINCVRGSGAVTCNHKTPQMGIHVRGPQRNLPSSLCCVHAIFGASGVLFGQSGQISSTVCTPSGPCTKKPFQTLWMVCFRLLGQVLSNNIETFFMLSLTGVYNKPKQNIFCLEFLWLQLALGASGSTSKPAQHLQQT